jgi:shikimate kinase
VVLVGLMGSGKTTVGRLLAQRLGRPVVDNDEELERRTGLSAADLAGASGVEALHEIEAEILLDALDSAVASVVVAAASVADDHRTMRVLRSPAVEVVWLRGAVDTLAARASQSSHRPLDGYAEAVLSEQVARRDPRYAEVASHVVDVERGSPAEIAELLVHRVTPVPHQVGPPPMSPPGSAATAETGAVRRNR